MQLRRRCAFAGTRVEAVLICAAALVYIVARWLTEPAERGNGIVSRGL